MPARKRKPRLIGFNLLTLFLIAGVVALVSIGLRRCGAATPPPAAPPQPVSQQAAEPRIIAMSPAIAIILRDLGLAAGIVGRHAHDMVLDKSVAVCGDQTNLDYEAILHARPTHIFMQAGATPIPPRLASLAAERGWVIKAYPMLTLDDIALAAGDLRLQVGRWRAEQASAASGARVAIDAAPGPVELAMPRAWSKRGEGFADAGRVLLLESLDPPAALGPGSFHHQVLERIGGVPAITSGSPYITMDAEDVLRLAPEAIIIFAPRPVGTAPAPALSADQLRAKLGRVGTLDIPAVKSGRIALIDHPLSLTPSTAMIEVADEMAGILKRWVD